MAEYGTFAVQSTDFQLNGTYHSIYNTAVILRREGGKAKGVVRKNRAHGDALDDAGRMAKQSARRDLADAKSLVAGPPGGSNE